MRRVGRPGRPQPQRQLEEGRLHDEQQRGDRDQPRHQGREIAFVQLGHEQCADQPADQARDDQQQRPAADLAQLAAVAPGAGQRPGQQGDRAGAVGQHLRHDRRQRREGQQRAAAGQRVDRAGRHRRRHQQGEGRG